MQPNLTTIEKLEAMAEIIPAPVYWVNLKSAVLGANECACMAIGASSVDEIIGKSPYDMYPMDLAVHIVNHNNEVMKKDDSLSQAEAIRDLTTGKTRYFITSKSPVKDKAGNIIGLVGSSIEVTSEREAETLRLEAVKKSSMLKHLQSLASLFPIPIYWNDLNSAVLGANELTLTGAGIASIHDVLGKTPFEMYPKEMAERIVKHNEEVIRTGQILSQEELIKDLSTGRERYYTAFKAPLRDEDGIIIGTLGISIETTAEKQAESLKLESKSQQIALEEKEKFVMVARKVAHDINSPLASLKMMMAMSTELHEFKRSTMNQAIESILDIANNLLSTYKGNEQQSTPETELREPLLLSDLLVQLLAEKRVQYGNRAIRFETEFDYDAQFAFTNMQSSQFRRSVSNLINNAVDAIDNQNNGRVIVKLNADHHSVTVTIQDNGKGMPVAMIEKMVHRQSFTEGKEHGHGIGLQQVWDTVDNNDGRMLVSSTPGEGTVIQIVFPRTEAASWIAHEIRPTRNGIVVILDDDESIHGAWDARFNPYLNTDSALRSYHFTHGQEVLDFFKTLSDEDREGVTFLSDYELLRQNKNGLQIIEESGIKNTTLVTSYYANPKIRSRATELGVKILPKQMASIVPIYVDD